MIARVAGKPGLHRRRLVSGVIVEHQVDAEIDRHRLRDPGEELAEFDGAVALVAAGDDPDGGDVQGGEQRGDAVALAVMAAPPGLARPIGDSGWVRSRALFLPGQALELRFFVDAGHQIEMRRKQGGIAALDWIARAPRPDRSIDRGR
jgi:hypothetical protein